MMYRTVAAVLVFVLAGIFIGCGGGAPDPVSTNAIPGGSNQQGTPKVLGPLPAYFTSNPVKEIHVGQTYDYQLIGHGNPAPSFFVGVAGLPAWLTLNGDRLTGTPGPADVGSYQIELEAANGVPPVGVQRFDLKVVDPPQILTSPPTHVGVGYVYRYAPTIQGFPLPTLRPVNPLPPWLKLSNNVLAGTPLIQHAGTYGISLVASNGVSPEAVMNFSIVVSSPNTPPRFASTPNLNATEGVAYSYDVNVVGNPQPALFVGGSLPAWLSIRGTQLVGTPTARDVGLVHNVDLSADNGVGQPATQSFSIQVSPASSTPTAPGPNAPPATNSPPRFTSTPVTGAVVGSAYHYDVRVSGSPMPTIILSGTLPRWLIYLNNTLRGTPTASDVGTYTITFIARNGVGSPVSQRFTITVVSANVYAPPVFTSTPVTNVQANGNYQYVISASGSPPPTFSLLHAPVGLSLNGNVLSGRAPSFPSSMNITIQANNGPSTATQSFTLNVNWFGQQMAPIVVAGLSRVPTINGDFVTPMFATEGTFFDLPITVIGSPPPILQVQSLPSWLTLQGNRLSGVPGSNAVQVMNEEVRIVATNGVPIDFEWNIVIHVHPANGPPLESPVFDNRPPAFIEPGQQFTYTPSAVSNPPSTNFHLPSTLPPWLTWNGRTLSGTPALEDIGIYPFTMIAENSIYPMDYGRFSITVRKPPQAGTQKAGVTLDQPLGYLVRDNKASIVQAEVWGLTGPEVLGLEINIEPYANQRFSMQRDKTNPLVFRGEITTPVTRTETITASIRVKLLQGVMYRDLPLIFVGGNLHTLRPADGPLPDQLRNATANDVYLLEEGRYEVNRSFSIDGLALIGINRRSRTATQLEFVRQPNLVPLRMTSRASLISGLAFTRSNSCSLVAEDGTVVQGCSWVNNNGLGGIAATGAADRALLVYCQDHLGYNPLLRQWETSVVKFIDCEFRNNAATGTHLWGIYGTGACASFERCSFSDLDFDSADNVVNFLNGPSSSFASCTFERNTLSTRNPNTSVVFGEVNMLDCSIVDNNTMGILPFSGGEFVGCDIQNNLLGGVSIRNARNDRVFLFDDCDIRENGTVQFEVFHHPMWVRIDNSILWHSNLPNVASIVVHPSSSPPHLRLIDVTNSAVHIPTTQGITITPGVNGNRDQP